MSSLAHISAVNGMRVGGSDRTPTKLTERLENEGVKIFYSHRMFAEITCIFYIYLVKYRGLYWSSL